MEIVKKNISIEDADKIIEKEESHFYDFKSKEVSGAKIQKIAVAFANADGGEVFVGIKDIKDETIASKRWDGMASMEEYNSILSALMLITPTLDVSKIFITCSGYSGYVLNIKVEKSSQVHCTSSNEYYLRNGAQSLKLTTNEQITNLKFAKGTVTYENELVPQTLPEIIYENENIIDFLKDFSPRTDPLEYCFSENLIHNKTCQPTVAGILLFANNPSANLPRKCAVKIVRYETKEDEPERDNLKETFTLEGPVYKLISSTVNKVSDIMSQIQVWGSDGKLKTMEYPKETIWEIITNAIIHRDYSISDDVQIHIYDNRVEVISPGKLPGGVTIDNILDTRYARNSKIVRTLSKYKDAPNKDIGEGLNTAFQKMKDWKLQSPKIEEQGNYVCVTIPHIPLARASELILNFLKNNEVITNKQARDITGIRSENSMKTEFYKLRDEGYLERVPGREGPSSAWRLTEKGKENQN